MAVKSYDSYLKKYDSFTKDYSSSYPSMDLTSNPYDKYFSKYSLSKDTTKAIGTYATREATYNQDNSGERSTLNRVFSPLLALNYGTQGFIKGFLDNNAPDNVSPIEGFLKGLRAGNPFGNRHSADEYSFSGNLERMGWTPDTTFGKIAKGTVGFLGDVLLDPTTYLSGGGSALLKGTGRVGRFGESLLAMTPEKAKVIIEESLHKSGTAIDAEQLARDAENYTREYNRVYGVGRTGGGMNLSLGNMPFGEKIFGKTLASKKIELASDSKLREIADSTLAPIYKTFRDSFYGSTLGDALNTKSALFQAGKIDPAALYHFMDFVDSVKGQKLGKQAEEKLIRDKSNLMFAHLDPAEHKQIMDLLQDKTIWGKVKPMINFAKTQEAQIYRDATQATRDAKKKQYDELVQRQADLEKQMEQHGNSIDDSFKQMADLKRSYKEQMLNFDVRGTQDAKIIEEHNKWLKRELDNLNNGHLAELNTEAMKNFTDEYAKFKNHIVENDKTHKLATDLTNMHRTVDDGTMSAADAEAHQVKQQAIFEQKKAIKENLQSNKNKLIDMINFHFFQGERQVGRAVPNNLLNDVLDMITSGKTRESISDYILENEDKFSGMAATKFKYIATQLGYKDWATTYVKPMEKLAKSKTLTPEQKLEFNRLEKLKMQRDALLKKFEHATTHQEVIQVIHDIENLKIGNWADVQDVEHLLNATSGKGVKSAREQVADQIVQDAANPDFKVKRIKDKDGKSRDAVVGKDRTTGANVNYEDTFTLSPEGKKIWDSKLIEQETDVTKPKLEEVTFGGEERKQALADFIIHMQWNPTKLSDEQKMIATKALDEYAYVLNDRIFAHYADLSPVTKKQLIQGAMERVTAKNPDLIRTGKNNEQLAKHKQAISNKPKVSNLKDPEYRAQLMKQVREDIALKKSNKQLIADVEARKAEIVRQLEENTAKLESLSQTSRRALIDDWKARIKDAELHHAEANKLYNEAKTELLTGQFGTLEHAAKRLRVLDDALDTDEAFESFARMEMGHGYVNDIVDANNPVKIYLDSRLDVNDKVKEIVRTIRDDFQKVALKELKIGKLSQEQVDANFEDYVYHMITPEFDRVLRAKREITPHGASVTQDFGYGMEFNQHGIERKVKKINLNGKWIKNPTIDQLNEYFAPLLKGNNAYVDKISDIYIARMQKHTDLMYDDMYMQTMLNRFGKDIPVGAEPDAKHAIVSNFGMVKKNLSDLAGLKTSMDISKMLSNVIKEAGMAKTLRDGRPSPLTQSEVDAHIKQFFATFTKADMKDLFHEHLNSTIESSGFTRKMLEENATPMIELDKEQHAKFVDHYNETHDIYDKFLLKREQSLLASGASSDRFDRLFASRAKLESVTPLQIRQVNGAIVQKANQARKLQIARDESDFLRIVDKITHIMKLNQTTILPSFHIRNKMANTFLNWLGVGSDAFSMELQTKAWQAVKSRGQLGATEVLFTKNGGYHWNDIYQLANAHGVIDEGFFAKDIGAGTQTKGMFPQLHIKKKDGSRLNLDPTDSENFIGYKKGAEVGNQIENSDRLIHFAARLKAGDSVEEAAYKSKQFLFDYSDLTAFETKYMKRLLPFYTWLRKNGALQIDQLLEQPGKYQYIAKLENWVDGMNNSQDRLHDGDVSSFARDWVQLPFNTTNVDKNGKPHSEPILMNPNLPFMDFSRIPNPMHPVQALKDVFTQSNPLIKVPAEQAMNKNVFFDAPIVTRDQSTGQQTGSRINHILGQFGVVNAGEGLVNAKNGADFGLNALNTFGGVKAMSYNVEGFKKLEAQNRSDNYNPLVDAYKKLNSVLGNAFTQGMSNAAHIAGDVAVDLMTRFAGTKPDAFVYNNAMRPISQRAYNALPMDEKAKYLPPTTEEAFAYNKRAKELEQQLYKNAPIENKLVWTLVDAIKGKPQHTLGSVTKVSDGDTFTVDTGDGKTHEVRMLLIDTPETVDKRKPIMPLGHEASDYSKSTLANQDVKLYFDGNKTDKYGRLLAYVELNGKDYNQELLQQGLAKVDYLFNGENYDRIKQYRSTEHEAAKQGKGIWSVPDYAQPNEPGIQSGYNLQGEAVRRMLEKLNPK